MKKLRPFDEAKPRTPKAEARRREAETMRLIDQLRNIHDEEEYKAGLAELCGIVPGHPKV